MISYDFMHRYMAIKEISSLTNKWVYCQALLEKRAARELQEPVAS